MTTEGLIGHRVSADRRSGILVEVVRVGLSSRGRDFQQMVEDVISEIERVGDAATDGWLADPNGPIRKRVAAGIAKLGENMGVRRFVRFTGQGPTSYTGQYIHLGGKIGVQVEFNGVDSQLAARDEFVKLVKEIAMQIAAASPAYIARAAVPVDILDREKSIYRAQVEGKPAQVVDKIVEGKLGSFYAQVVLPDQASIRDPKMTVADVLAAAAKTLGRRSRSRGSHGSRWARHRRPRPPGAWLLASRARPRALSPGRKARDL